MRGVGRTREEAYEAAAWALTAVITEPARIAAVIPVPIHCEAPDDEILLVDWLNALVFEMATRRMLFGRFSVRIGKRSVLDGTAWGEALDRERHEPAIEVKGATYTALRVGREPNGDWIAQCVVDV